MPRKNYAYVTRSKDGVVLTSRDDLKAKCRSYSLCPQCKYTGDCRTEQTIKYFGSLSHVITPVFECMTFESKYRNHQDKDKIYANDIVGIDLDKQATLDYLACMNIGPRTLRDVCSRIKRCRSFRVSNKSGKGQEALYTLENKEGKYCGTWPSHCLFLSSAGQCAGQEFVRVGV